MPHEIDKPSTIHPGFKAYATSAVDVEKGVLRGRPYGGLAVMWRTQLDRQVKIINYNDPRILGVSLVFEDFKLLLLNVYLPTQSPDNLDIFLSYLGKIASIIREADFDHICVIGDFNAKCDSSFFRELQTMSSSNSLLIADMLHLPPDSVTHFSEAHTTGSWLDHVLVSENLRTKVSNFRILSGICTSNHFPLQCDITIAGRVLEDTTEVGSQETIKWDFNDAYKMNLFSTYLEEKVAQTQLDFCNNANCSSERCAQSITRCYRTLQRIVEEGGRRYFGIHRTKRNIIPGWNLHLRQLHERAREAFLEWRRNGSPREGPEAYRMREARATFKRALRQCRREEARMREEALAEKLRGKQMHDFWQLANAKKKASKLSSVIDGIFGAINVTEVWRTKFSTLFNTSRDTIKKSDIRRNIYDEYEFITNDQVKTAISKISINKAVGADGIAAEVLRAARDATVNFFTILINSMLRHSFIPAVVMEVTLIPLLKSKLKDETLSKSYRPIAIATAFSKLLELIILSKCDNCLKSSDNQFGFKRGHSTDLCIYTLKETVNYYTRLGSPVFIAFIDIEKAFDKLNHEKLFKILKRRGIPLYIVNVLMFWYIAQQFQIRWGGTLSRKFSISNGIRQGGLLSPLLFNAYMENLSIQLNSLGVGCFVTNKCVNHICYADDLVVLAPSVRALQSLLDV